jgi:hypothetical protein
MVGHTSRPTSMAAFLDVGLGRVASIFRTAIVVAGCAIGRDASFPNRRSSNSSLCVPVTIASIPFDPLPIGVAGCAHWGVMHRSQIAAHQIFSLACR